MCEGPHKLGKFPFTRSLLEFIILAINVIKLHTEVKERRVNRDEREAYLPLIVLHSHRSSLQHTASREVQNSSANAFFFSFLPLHITYTHTQAMYV